MLTLERSRGTQLGARWRSRWRIAKEQCQVAVLIQLVPAGPEPNGQHTCNSAVTSNPILGRHPDLIGDLQTLVNFQKKLKRAKVVPREAGRIDLCNLTKTSKGFLNLAFIPVLVGEMGDHDVGDPGGTL